MKDELIRVAAMVCVLALVAPGCGGDGDPPPVDLGPEEDMNVPVDLDLDRDMGPPPCEGPPGLYVAGSCTELAAGVRPFRPRFQLWTDGADKERFIRLPSGGVIDTSDPDGWVFPVGTVLWKTFSRGGMRLETRVLTKTAAGEGMDSWSFQTYGWNQTQDDVTLVGVDGIDNVLGTTHDIPSREACLSCHAAATRDAALGFSAIQLADVNLPLSLDDLAAASEMSDVITISSAATPGTTVQRNALGYLHANCSHCHGGVSPQVGLNMQLEVGLTGVCETNTYLTALAATDDMAGGCTTPGTASFWMAGANMKRVDPNSLATSAIYQRMNVRTLGNQMPPIGTEDVDTMGLMTIQDWIMGDVPHVP